MFVATLTRVGNPSAIERQHCQHQESANGTLGVMLSEFAYEFLRSLKSLFVEMKCHMFSVFRNVVKYGLKVHV